MEQATQAGWCVVDFKKNIFTVSDYLAEVFQINDGVIPFDSFMESIHPDYAYRAYRGAEEWLKSKHYEQAFPVRVGTDYIWVQSKIGPVEKNEQGDEFAVGMMRVIDPAEYERYEDHSSKKQLGNLLDSQSSVSQLLLRLLQNPDIDAIINDILASILEKFDADRSYIFSLNWVKRTHSCVYEVTKEGVTSEMDDLRDFPIDIDESLWWCTQLYEGRSLIYEDISVLKESHPALFFGVLNPQGIKSLMVVPLLSGGGVWGYIGVDIVGYKRTWSIAEQQWFRTLSNYISVCLELHKALGIAHSSGRTMREIYRNLPLGIELYDAEGLLEDINDIDLKIFNTGERTKILGMSLFQHPVLPDTEIESLRKGENITTDVSHRFTERTRGFYNTNYEGRKDLFVKCNILYDADGNVEHYLMMFMDNTAMLETYKKMHEAESLFNSISEFAEVGFYRLDHLKKDFFATDQWYKNMSLNIPDPGDTAVYRESYFSVLHPEDKEKFIASSKKIIAGEIRSFKQDVRVHDGNEWKWLRCENMVSEYDPENGSIVIIGLNDNITEAKRIEKNLTQAKLKAEESDRLKSAFLANMSHEIRTPLNAIVGFSTMLTESDDPEEREEFVSIIRQSNEQLLQLIADILDLSKIEAGVLELSYGDVDVNSMCETLVSSMRMKAQPGVTITFEPTLQDCTMYSDRNRLTQILSNYLGNAVKFTSRGTIKLSYLMENGYIEFRVEDTGMGMTKEQLKQVFGRFVKFNTFIQGTGLGLSICKSIAEKLNGQVGVASEPGKGSCFWFRLPFAKGRTEDSKEALLFDSGEAAETVSSSKKESQSQETGEGIRRKKILVAEDNDSNALLIAAALRHDYDIIRAVNGLEAVEKYRSEHPDLILMDIKMPDMDGFEATRIIRQADKDIPIIAVTAFAFDSDRERALEIGCTEYLAKPIIPGTLRKIIKQYI